MVGRSNEAKVPAFNGYVNPEKLIGDIEPEQARALLNIWSRGHLPVSGTVALEQWRRFVQQARDAVPLNGWWWIYTIYGNDAERLHRLLEKRADSQDTNQPSKIAWPATKDPPTLVIQDAPPDGRAPRRTIVVPPSLPTGPHGKKKQRSKKAPQRTNHVQKARRRSKSSV